MHPTKKPIIPSAKYCKYKNTFKTLRSLPAFYRKIKNIQTCQVHPLLYMTGVSDFRGTVLLKIWRLEMQLVPSAKTCLNVDRFDILVKIQ